MVPNSLIFLRHLLVIAASGVKVAKHGNRAASSKCGAADVLGFGSKIDVTPEKVPQY